jgi:hypothetical protein
MLVGIPGAGKTWATSQVKDDFTFVRNDDHIGDNYVEAILKAAENSLKPLLIEAPFSMKQIQDPLEYAGYRVIPVFIIEKPEVIAARYYQREGREIPKGHLTRMKTYAERAKACRGFAGTSQQVLEHLKAVS